MYKKLFALLVLGLALPASALAGSKINKHSSGLHSIEKFETASRANSARKSKRQKCLDMMLPQDGADCLKKLKKKK
ncbi:MAG: hypothetical protein JJ964_02550 [Rhizobiales bacterium]|nr:hypothetical protein [Hyphomicrobiales bacterium]